MGSPPPRGEYLLLMISPFWVRGSPPPRGEYVECMSSSQISVGSPPPRGEYYINSHEGWEDERFTPATRGIPI